MYRTLPSRVGCSFQGKLFFIFKFLCLVFVRYYLSSRTALENCALFVITQALSLGLVFGFLLLLFFFFLRSVTNRHLVSTEHASLMHAYGTKQKLSSRKATSSDSIISRAMKSHTNEHTVRGRPTLKVVKRFRKGSVCKAYERSTIYERTF